MLRVRRQFLSLSPFYVSVLQRKPSLLLFSHCIKIMGLQEKQNSSLSDETNSIHSFYFVRSLNTIPNTFKTTATIKPGIVKNELIIENCIEKQRENETKRLWKNADAVCFDVDSTVCQNEAIDDLAEFLGVSAEVAHCTREAMGGQMTFREALSRRLDLMRPTQKQLNDFIASDSIRLTPGIAELVAELKRRKVDVYLVSGGFRSVIRPVAELLQIDFNNIYANKILFNQNGTYKGFDKNELTSDSGLKTVGKAGVCAQLKARNNYKTLIMVGDGATDAEACPPADGFIGFGGNQVRDSVKKLSDWYVLDFKVLRDELKNLTN